MINALGIDVEEWYHLCGLNLPVGISDQYQSRVMKNTDRMLKLLERLQTKATFFVLGVVAEKFPALVKDIVNAGHEVGSHGYRHIEVYRHTQESFKDDLKRSIEILQGITGKPILGYRAPGFSITRETLWAIDILIENKIEYDCSIFPIRHPRYGIPSAPRVGYRIRPDLVELPPSTVRILRENFAVAGGAYLRFLPYRFLQKAVKSLNEKGIPANSYLHVWEIDPDQPKLKIPFKRHISHYWGLGTAQEKFEKLLADFQFVPISKVIKDGRL